MRELLGGHNDCLQRLVGQLNDHLPSPLTITLPTFTPGEVSLVPWGIDMGERGEIGFVDHVCRLF